MTAPTTPPEPENVDRRFSPSGRPAKRREMAHRQTTELQELSSKTRLDLHEYRVERQRLAKEMADRHRCERAELDAAYPAMIKVGHPRLPVTIDGVVYASRHLACKAHTRTRVRKAYREAQPSGQL